MCHSVGGNNITGDAANHLATVVLDHAAMTDFCGIPLTSLRENSITELDLAEYIIGLPGAIVLSKLLPSAAALASLKCACRPKVFAFLSATRTCSLTAPAQPPGSLHWNHIGPEGASALAAVLKETQITNLKCAAAPSLSVRLCVSAH